MNNFHICCFTCSYCPLTDVKRGRHLCLLPHGSPFPSCPLLIPPHISSCTFLSSPLFLTCQKLCKNVRDLEHVDVSHCAALSDPAIRAISFYCRGLITLRMSGCHKVHTYTSNLLKPLNVILRYIFSISSVLPQMTDMAAQYLTSGSQYLRELDVSGCVLLTDRTLRHLERICPPLCSITMACCNSISK